MTMVFIISLFMAFRMRKSLVPGEAAMLKWDKILTWIMVFSGVLIFVSSSLQKPFFLLLVGYALMGWLFYTCWKEPEFSTQKTLLLSLAPLGAIYFLIDVSRVLIPGFYHDNEGYYGTARVIGFAWVIATIIMYNRQMKAVKAERLLREREAEENRITAVRKAQLEVLVKERTSELLEQNEKLKQALDELSAAQKQLIHSEKMASLGELTAGIAHEIQNPLNFVNNFAELNAELSTELLDALDAKEIQEARSLAISIRDNQDKVVHHGKRADSIVKSMLQHSRGSGSSKEKIDLNALADECIRLSYHGMRAKEKSFNAKMELSLNPDIGLVEVIPGDISRVLLNICTNAFYAVLQRMRNGEKGYQPTVWLETGRNNEGVWFKVRDNGGGIPPEAKEKIFQPFFTTKPTGEGTGLGLSMSYDIVTKGHGGDIHVDSKEGEGAEFLVTLPV